MADDANATAFSHTVACEVCSYPQWSFDDDSPIDEYEIRLQSIDDVRKSAGSGCHACSLFLQVWQHAVLDSDMQAKSVFIFNKASKKMSETLDVHILVENSKMYDVDLYTLPGRPKFAHIRTANSLPPTTHLTQNLPMIQSWLSTCLKSHAKCNAPTSTLPTRLLDLNPLLPSTIRLIETTSIPTSTPYACLSHCWGSTRHIHITTSNNLTSNMTSIPISELPLTYRDAIDITRTLGLRYLWIDSLCIIQNSDADWAMHVEIMAGIYSGAWVTLGAGKSEGDGGGFFDKVPDRWLEETVVDVGGEEGQIVYVRPGIDHPDADWPAQEVLPLMKRGWVFQERLLSRRYLCFGSKEILWECLQEVACSCSTNPGGYNPRLGEEAKFRGSAATKTKLYSEKQDHKFWRSLVTEYTSRQLTYVQDRLPALKGLANMFQGRFDMGDYFHGMWTFTLAEDLAWRSVGKDAPLGRPRQGPSWSWAYASDGPIDWPGISQSGYYQFLASSNNETNEHPSLLLRGTLLPIALQTWSDRAAYEVYNPLTRYCRVHELDSSSYFSSPDSPASIPNGNILPGSFDDQPEALTSSDPSVPTYLSGHINSDYRFWSTEEELHDMLRDCVFFVLGMEETDYFFSSELEEDSKVWVVGLLLKSCSRSDGSGDMGSEYERYERVGCLRYFTDRTKREFVPRGRKAEFELV